MATAKKLPSGSWRCQVYSHTEETVQSDGTLKKKRIYKSFTSDVPGPKGKRLAEQAASQWAAEKESVHGVQNISFGEALERYIESRESVLSPRTIMDYKRIRKNELQSIMNIKIEIITQEDIQRAINIEAQSRSPKTVRNSHGLVSAVLHIYRPNFALNTTMPKKIHPTIYIPSENEIKLLLKSVSDTDMELPVLLAAFGPMRRGEICALTSDDISGNVVHVCKNMVINENKKWIIKTPKSYAGDRYIDYPDFVAEKWKGIKGNIVSLTPDSITGKFNRILKKNNIKHFRFHDLRHYSASIQHALGIPDSYIMQRGGWGNDGTLKAVYRHALEEQTISMNGVANNYFSELYNTKCNTKKENP